jgi:hypothetical protein
MTLAGVKREVQIDALCLSEATCLPGISPRQRSVQERIEMDWPRLLAYITGTVDQELLLRNEYLAAENRILKGDRGPVAAF